MKLDSEEGYLTANINQIKFALPETGKVNLEVELAIAETDSVEKVAFTAVPRVSNDDSLTLEDVEYPEDYQFSPKLTSALLNSTSEVLNLRNFALKEMSLHLKSITIFARN